MKGGTAFDVEASGGLVQENRIWVTQQGQGQMEPAFLSGREGVVPFFC